MGCNCGGQKSGQATEYRYTSPGGQVTTYRTEVEAMAARVRNSGQGTVTAVAK